MDHCVIETPAGRLCIWETRGYITECSWVEAPLRAPESQLLRRAADEVAAYFKGEQRSFDLPVAAPGTEAEQAVWQALLSVPYGKTVSAKRLADRLFRGRQLRMVVKACNTNPVVLFVPCHRVVGEGNDGGYIGGMAVKYKLWDVEGIRRKDS